MTSKAHAEVQQSLVVCSLANLHIMPCMPCHTGFIFATFDPEPGHLADFDGLCHVACVLILGSQSVKCDVR